MDKVTTKYVFSAVDNASECQVEHLGLLYLKSAFALAVVDYTSTMPAIKTGTSSLHLVRGLHSLIMC